MRRRRVRWLRGLSAMRMRKRALPATARRAAVGTLAAVTLLVGGCHEKDGVTTGDIPMSSTGGSLVVQCVNGNQARLVSWQPAPGYVAKVVVQGPSAEASIHFDSAAANDFRVAVRCVDAKPRLEEFVDEDLTLSTAQP